MLAMIGAGAALALALVAQAPERSAACQGAISADWSDAATAFDEGRYEAAEGLLAGVEQACAADALELSLTRTLMADLALRRGDAPTALQRLDAAQTSPEDRFWPVGRWLEMAAHRALGDEAGFRRAWGELLAEAEGGMAARGMVEVEVFDTPAARVRAYAGGEGVPHGVFVRRMVFVAEPRALEWPQSLMLTRSPASQMMAELEDGEALADALFVDGYTCWSHATMDIVDGQGPAAAYPALRARALEAFSDPARFAAPEGDDREAPTAAIGSCVASGFLLPGLD